MSRSFRYLTWWQFDDSVEWIARSVRKPVGVFGMPRGGLPLAVALSHRLGVPLLDEMEPGALWVDDIVDTGLTLSRIRHHWGDRCQFAAWIQRGDHDVIAPIQTWGEEWIVFPWEPKQTADHEAQDYEARR